MNIYIKTLILVLTFYCHKILADATPFKDKESIEVRYKTTNKIDFDSCGIIYLNRETNSIDTFYHCKGGECVYVSDINNIILTRLIPDTFRVALFFKDKILTSPKLNQKGMYSYHQLLVTDNSIEETTPIFRTSYENYVFAFLITIILELIVALIYFRQNKIPSYNLRFIALANILSHPILWIVAANLTGFFIGNLIGEPLVIVFEATLLYIFMRTILSYKKTLWLSIKMNIVSFLLGGTIYLMFSN